MEKKVERHAIGSSYSYFDLFNSDRPINEQYKRGTFTSKNGIVDIYSQIGYAMFTFIYNGRAYYMTINHKKDNLSDRSLAIHAGKFIRSIITP